eukprot:gene17506-23818_t
MIAFETQLSNSSSTKLTFGRSGRLILPPSAAMPFPSRKQWNIRNNQSINLDTPTDIAHSANPQPGVRTSAFQQNTQKDHSDHHHSHGPFLGHHKEEPDSDHKSNQISLLLGLSCFLLTLPYSVAHPIVMLAFPVAMAMPITGNALRQLMEEAFSAIAAGSRWWKKHKGVAHRNHRHHNHSHHNHSHSRSLNPPHQDSYIHQSEERAVSPGLSSMHRPPSPVQGPVPQSFAQAPSSPGGVDMQARVLHPRGSVDFVDHSDQSPAYTSGSADYMNPAAMFDPMRDYHLDEEEELDLGFIHHGHGEADIDGPLRDRILDNADLAAPSSSSSMNEPISPLMRSHSSTSFRSPSRSTSPSQGAESEQANGHSRTEGAARTFRAAAQSGDLAPKLWYPVTEPAPVYSPPPSRSWAPSIGAHQPGYLSNGADPFKASNMPAGGPYSQMEDGTERHEMKNPDNTLPEMIFSQHYFIGALTGVAAAMSINVWWYNRDSIYDRVKADMAKDTAKTH